MALNRSLKKGGRELVSVLLLFALFFIRFTYYGLKYYPQLDDYLHYSVYTADKLTASFLTTRPLASMLDVYLWSNFWGNLIVAVLILSVLYTLAIYLLMRVFRQYFSCGWMFLLIAALLPMGFEGLYWLSASTRIIAGLFFASLAALMLQCFLESGKWYFAIPFVLLQLISCFFYEQILLLSLAITLVQCVLSFRKVRWLSLAGLLSPVNVIIYFIVISCLGQSGRAEFANPFLASYWTQKLPALLRQFFDCFISANFFTTVKGFARGLQYSVRDGAWLYLLGVLALCVVLFLLQYRSTEGKFSRRANENNRQRYKPLAALVLFLFPLGAFFVLRYNWFSLRNAVPCFIGLALLGDWLVEAIFGEFKHRKGITATVVALFALVCCIASVSEIHDYHINNRNDTKLVRDLAPTLQQEPAGEKVGILHLEESYLESWNYQYHEHFTGCGSSAWALNSAMDALTGKAPDCDVTPLAVHPPYSTPETAEAKRLTNFDKLYFYEIETGGVTEVTYQETPEGNFEVYLPDGRLLFTIWYGPDGCGYVRW